MSLLRRIAIAEQLSASPAVRAGLAWFTERFANHTNGALTREQFKAFEGHLLDYASAHFAGQERVPGSFDLSDNILQVAIRNGMLDNMVLHAARQLGMSWPDGLSRDLHLVVDIRETQVRGRYNADDTAVVWPVA